jgi:hypothetical protein
MAALTAFAPVAATEETGAGIILLVQIEVRHEAFDVRRFRRDATPVPEVVTEVQSMYHPSDRPD